MLQSDPVGRLRFGLGLAFVLVLCRAGFGQPGSLFADPKAGRIGDALTVVIMENASASNRTATSTDKSNKLQIGSDVPKSGNILGFVPLHALKSNAQNRFQGKASTTRSANLSARVTVNVVGLKPNGDLVVEGVRTLKINGETEAIYLSGSVNPAFISRQNTVPSTKIADLHMEYTGRGTVTQGARPGVLVRLVNWIF